METVQFVVKGKKTVLKEWESLDLLMLASNMVTKLKYIVSFKVVLFSPSLWQFKLIFKKCNYILILKLSLKILIVKSLFNKF